MISPRRFLQTVALLLLVSLCGGCSSEHPPLTPSQNRQGKSNQDEPSAGQISDGEQAILDAFAAQKSDEIVEAEGKVESVLSDDLKGSRHQRFIVRFSTGHTVLVAHNIDLASRVPMQEGDTVRIRGEYEYNDRGGVVHWTHRDPQRRRPGGWIQHQGAVYR